MFRPIRAAGDACDKAARVTVSDSFDAFARDWQGACPKPTEKNVFLTTTWFRIFAETVPLGNAGMRIYRVQGTDSGKYSAAVLPMYAETDTTGKRGPRKLVSLANYYSGLFGPANDGFEPVPERFAERIAAAIAAERPRWDVVNLHPLDTDSPFHDAIRLALRRAGMATFGYFCHGNWYLDVAGRSFAEYYSQLPGRLRSTIARKTRQLDSADRLRVDIVTGGDRLEDAIAAYDTVYRSSWKPQETYPDFIPALIRLAGREGWLRLGIAYIDGVPAAAQIWIVFEGVASIYKLAYDERFTRESIGSILTARLMQHAIDVDRVREVDFLSGDDAYKKDWMSHRRERHGIIAFNLRTPYGMYGAMKERVRNLLRPLKTCSASRKS